MLTWWACKVDGGSWRHVHAGSGTQTSVCAVECVWNLLAHGDARECNWRGKWRMEWEASTLILPRNVVYPALLKLMRTPRLPAVDWTDSPADLNGLVRFGERWNLVSARVSSCFKRTIPACRYWLLVSLHSQCLCRSSLQKLAACVATRSVSVLYQPADTDYLCHRASGGEEYQDYEPSLNLPPPPPLIYWTTLKK